MKSMVWVLTWVDPTGDLRFTGRYSDRYGQEPVMEPTPKAYACVWSRDQGRALEGERYAKESGHALMVMEDSADVLDNARAAILESWRVESEIR